MPKIQNVSLGNYIRNPRGGRTSAGVHISKILKVSENQGNTFLCYEVIDPTNNPPVIDTTRYQMIPIDTNVDEVSL